MYWLDAPDDAGGAEEITGTASGTIRYAPDVATVTSDCQGGGWRDLVDANGQPFRNQGRCTDAMQR